MPEQIVNTTPIPGYEDFGATRDGRIFRVKPWTSTRRKSEKYPYELSQCLGGSGYPLVTVHNKLIAVHRLIAFTFVPGMKPGLEVNHIDGDKTNSHADNLEWVTRGDNHRHAYRTGLKSRKGEKNCGAKLTESEVLEIVEKLKTGRSQRSIGEDYGVTQSTIWAIKSGRQWGHVTGIEENKSTDKSSKGAA